MVTGPGPHKLVGLLSAGRALTHQAPLMFTGWEAAAPPPMRTNNGALPRRSALDERGMTSTREASTAFNDWGSGPATGMSDRWRGLTHAVQRKPSPPAGRYNARW